MKRNLFKNEHGQALIFITLAFVVLGMFVGLAVDGGRGYLMRERLRKIVDAAALAGAKALAAVPEGEDPLDAAKKAACDSAAVNGVNRDDCEAGKQLVVELAELENPDKSKQTGVVVTGTDRARTFFMALGALIGCETCKELNVIAAGRAVPDTLADVVLVLDDTGTMSCTPGKKDAATCAIEGAKAGATGLINTLFKDPGSHAMIAYVPFRGCYVSGPDRLMPQNIEDAYKSQGVSAAEIARRGCILFSETVDLTKDKKSLTDQIATRSGSPGFPGTNICLAMVEGSKKLFGKDAREIARKVMIILTDGSQNYSDFSDGGPLMKDDSGALVDTHIPNLGNPTPSPYPKNRYVPGSGDDGLDSDPSCKSVKFEPGFEPMRWGKGGTVFDNAISELDSKAFARAKDLKQNKKVEIYVLRYTRSDKGDALTTGDPAGSCDPNLVGDSAGVQRGGKDGAYDDDNASNDPRDRNFARCIATNLPGDYGVDPSNRNSHYFFAATPGAIQAAFDAIAKDILKKRRLVG